MPRRRHNGPVKTIYCQTPSRYREAVDQLKRDLRRPIRQLMLEAIELLAMKHQIITEPSDLWILDFPDVRPPVGNPNQ